jgi:hypothetical protein
MVSAVTDRDSWALTLRELILKSLLGLWIAAFVVSVLSEAIPAYYPLGMASVALMAFVLFPSKLQTIEADSEQKSAPEDISGREVA